MTSIEWSYIPEDKLIETIAKVILSYEFAEIKYNKLMSGQYNVTAEVDGARPDPFCFDEEKWSKFIEVCQSLGNKEDGPQ